MKKLNAYYIYTGNNTMSQWRHATRSQPLQVLTKGGRLYLVNRYGAHVNITNGTPSYLQATCAQGYQV